jgi:hypothetical protein
MDNENTPVNDNSGDDQGTNTNTPQDQQDNGPVQENGNPTPGVNDNDPDDDLQGEDGQEQEGDQDTSEE